MFKTLGNPALFVNAPFKLQSAWNFKFIDYCQGMTSPLEQQIREQILSEGPLSFAPFMNQALYHAKWGYYSRPDSPLNIGKGGDFFTNVSVGPLFGRLLARQLHHWWQAMGKSSPFHVVEAGGFDGTLAFDLLTSLESESPKFFSCLQYLLIEPLPALKHKQQDRLSPFLNKVQWIPSIQNLPTIQGVLLGNELLDAFPVQFLDASQEEPVELLVGWEEPTGFAWKRGSPFPRSLASIPLAYGGQLETCPEVCTWIQNAAEKIIQGRILLIDYGYTDEEYFAINRPHGTLRAYSKHKTSTNVLKHPGNQDITAHVRWTPIIEAAKRAGCKMEELIQQSRWLTQILIREKLQPDPAEIRQFQTLTHPEILGEPFRVMILSRGI